MNLTLAIILSLFNLISSPQSKRSLNEYLELFKADAKRFGVTLNNRRPRFLSVQRDLIIKDEEGNNMEVDAYVAYSSNVIYLDSRSRMFQDNRKVLVYHELGHYYLDRAHTDEQSIMNSEIWDTTRDKWDDLSPEDQEYYIKELFANYKI